MRLSLPMCDRTDLSAGWLGRSPCSAVSDVLSTRWVRARRFRCLRVHVSSVVSMEVWMLVL